MKFGVFGINVGVCADAEVGARVARRAEELGYESVWTGEHVVLPAPQAPPSPVPPETPFLDPAISLAFIAARTSTIKLGTGIIILPQRNPCVLAKELASVDVVSGGRLIFGLGVGYLKAEFDALGIPFTRKGPRTDDYLQAMLALWTQENPQHSGEFASFEGIQALPQPLQKPHPPVVVGGHSPHGLRRAVASGNGWYGFAMTPEQTAESLEGIEEAKQQVERPSSLGDLEITITPSGAVDADVVKRYENLGVDRLVFLTFAADGDGTVGVIEETAKAIGLN
jgi:probable F420-dependent oxidoreductase